MIKKMKKNKGKKMIKEIDRIHNRANMIKILVVIENLKVKIHQEAQEEKKEDLIQDQEENQKMAMQLKMQSKKKLTPTQIFLISGKTIIKLIKIFILKMTKTK
jgi:hypothetical protein